MPTIVSARSTGTRPNRSSTGPPSTRAAVIATVNTPNTIAPVVSSYPCPSTTARASQSFADPSANDMPSMMTPMRSSRTSPHTERLSRSRSVQGGRGASVCRSSPTSARRGTKRTATTTATAMSTAMIARCTETERAMADAAAASAAPATVPNEKNACMRGMTVLPISRSASAPSTFIMTSTVPLPKPKSARPMTTSGTDGSTEPPTPTSTRPTDTVTSAPIMPARAPSLARSHGAAMSPRTEAIDPERMTSPTPCVLSPVSSRIAGMRATQLASDSPLRKKIAKIALRHAESSRVGRPDSVVWRGVSVIVPASWSGSRVSRRESNRFDSVVL